MILQKDGLTLLGECNNGFRTDYSYYTMFHNNERVGKLLIKVFLDIKAGTQERLYLLKRTKNLSEEAIFYNRIFFANCEHVEL